MHCIPLHKGWLYKWYVCHLESQTKWVFTVPGSAKLYPSQGIIYSRGGWWTATLHRRFGVEDKQSEARLATHMDPNLHRDHWPFWTKLCGYESPHWPGFTDLCIPISLGGFIISCPPSFRQMVTQWRKYKVCIWDETQNRIREGVNRDSWPANTCLLYTSCII